MNAIKINYPSWILKVRHPVNFNLKLFFVVFFFGGGGGGGVVIVMNLNTHVYMCVLCV